MPKEDTQFKPGNCANPGGRPKKRPLTEGYAKVLNHLFPEKARRAIDPGQEFLKKGEATWADAIALKLAQDSLRKGGYSAAKELREATEGKAPQRFEIATTEDREVRIKVEYAVTESKELVAQPQHTLDVKSGEKRWWGDKSLPVAAEPEQLEPTNGNNPPGVTDAGTDDPKPIG